MAKVGSFIIFNQKNNKLVRKWQDKETYILGAQLVKNLNRIWAWGGKLKR